MGLSHLTWMQAYHALRGWTHARWPSSVRWVRRHAGLWMQEGDDDAFYFLFIYLFSHSISRFPLSLLHKLKSILILDKS